MIKKILPHFLIIMSLFFLTLLVLDQFNSAMYFIDHDITKTLLIVTFVITLFAGILFVADQRRS